MEKNNLTDETVFAVDPKKDCPHFSQDCVQPSKDKMEEHLRTFTEQKCNDCENVGENWFCLTCLKVFCSRYVNKHMLEHNKSQGHNTALSFSDGSFWCFACESYIINDALTELRVLFAQVKFAKEDEELLQLFQKLNLKEAQPFLDEKKPQQEEEEEQKREEADHHSPAQPQEEETKQDIEGQLQNLLFRIGQNIDTSKAKEQFTRQQFVEGVKEKRFKKVCFMVGAGISVSAGIPDFRTPGTGLYSQLQKYNLPQPEAVFDLGFFRKNPNPFYLLSKEFQVSGCKPTINHYFITEFFKQGLLDQCLTQNIDGLELDAGLPAEKCVQAHGHYRSAHCINCKEEADIKIFNKHVEEGTIYKCTEENCQGLIKPDIVFFGEALPEEFFDAADKVSDCDLAIVMGTSLKVAPFSMLVSMVNKNVPLILINRENPGIVRQNFLFLEGDLDATVESLMRDFGWEVPQIQKKQPLKLSSAEVTIQPKQ